ncbi:AvrD family protein [Streptomyces maoxianensis]|uniref:AvrD family protein n=1 Tax=Streptomyces maoxianensis TaxID=1459942 RepID=A0ABV9G057_9ACTN
MSSGATKLRRNRIPSIDDYLGPRDQRFFGEGFKRGVHQVGEIVVGYDDAGTGHVRGRASVSYPADWSRKGDTDQRPHLSTIDVLVLGVQLSEVYLAHSRGLGEQQRAGAWLRRAWIKAGSSPVEDDLQGFDIEAVLAEVRPSPDGPDRLVSVLDSRIGTLTIRTEIDHPVGTPVTTAGRYSSLDALLGDSAQRPFGSAYKNRRQIIEDVEVVLGDELQDTRAGVRFDIRSDVPVAGQGIEGLHQPSVSMIDSFVVGLQLGQVMLYELDGVSRAESNTLWMRQTVLEADSPLRPLDRCTETSAHLADSIVLNTSKGESWRRADIVGELGGVRLRCSVAHQLPRR